MASTYTEDHLVEQPAIQLMQHELGWDAVNCYDEWNGGASYLGREGTREVVLTGRLKPALHRLNPGLPAEALDAAVEEFGRDFFLSARSFALGLGAAGLFERNPGRIRKSLTNSEFLFKSKTSA